MSITTTSRTGRELLKALRTPVARFYPCDLHVHSLGSFDVCLQDRFDLLPPELKRKATEALKGTISLPLAKEPKDAGKFDETMSKPEVVQAFLEELIARRDLLAQAEGISESDNWCVLGITDHNTSHFSCALSELAWQSRTTNHVVIVPGIELEVVFPLDGVEEKCQVHILCHFAPGTKASDILLAINNAKTSGSPAWVMGQPLEVANLAEFVNQLRHADSYPAICVAAHVWSKKGVQNEPKKLILAQLDAQLARLEGELARAKSEGSSSEESEIQNRLDGLHKERDDDAVTLSILRIIGTCGFDALQVRDQSHETHYRRLHRFREFHGRAVPIVSSDSHSPETVFTCVSGTPFAKVATSVLIGGSQSEVFDELRNRVLRFGETRMTYAKPGSVRYWIEGIEISRDTEHSKEFWKDAQTAAVAGEPFTLALSRNLNCFVGGRGSGKSAGVEALAFIAGADDFKAAGQLRTPSDWYLRAKATLAGCRIRLVWKSTGEIGIGSLPKKALIASRYFDLNGMHEPVELRDADDNAIVQDGVVVPEIRILRVHEIEETARADNLRKLFDDLCGSQIVVLNGAIGALRGELAEQRKTIREVIDALSVLTVDSSPLRQYGLRKKQFESVNKPELQERFEEVDKSARAARAIGEVYDSWEELDVAGTTGELEVGAKDFLTTADGRIARSDDTVPPEFVGIAALIAESGAAPGKREVLLSHLQAAKESAADFGVALFAVKEAAEKTLQVRTDDLAKDGLPTGSSERESKRKAFEQAETDLSAYTTKMKELEELLQARAEIHSRMVEKCKERTRLREKRANELTSQLTHDLDANVLKIEVKAQRMADRKELDDWLRANVEPTFAKYKGQRRAALLDSGLMPHDLRVILLHDGEPDTTPLQNSYSKAEDGRIQKPDADEIVLRCRGKRLVPLDEHDRWDDDFVKALPDSIREGVIVFPLVERSQERCIDRVLQLDEVVLEDSAEVRLNDRPEDPQSEPRPLEVLSPGQRCSAILPILLLSGDYPLVIDQPEENLDNRLIRQVIVNILASMKLRRQVIIATHNPNLPVLGDVEQCVVLQARGRDLSSVVASGNLDSAEVAKYITDIMEGGREAFQYRQSIYQFHWTGTVESSGIVPKSP